MNDPVTLRPATVEDVPLLQRVYASTREEELAQVAWSEEQKSAFVEMQFRAQDTDYHTNYPDAAYDVILRNGTPAGRLYVQRGTSEICILDIALLPAHRGAGIGGALLRELIAESSRVEKPLVIYVEKFNRAQTLYRRLGFVEMEDTGVYWRMVRAHSAAA